MYKKQGDYQTLDEYVRFKTGKSIPELDAYKAFYEIRRLEKAAEMIKRHIAAQLPIAVFTDYDVDGLGSRILL